MPVLVVIKVRVAWLDPMGGLGAITTPHVPPPTVHYLLDSVRRAHLLPLPMPAAVFLAIALIGYPPFAAMSTIAKLETAGRGLGYGSLPGSTSPTLALAMVASLPPPSAAVNAGGLALGLTATEAARSMMAHIITDGQGMVTWRIIPLVHQFKGAVGKAERLGRACRPQFVGWIVSLGPTAAAEMAPPLLFAATMRVRERKRESTLGSPLCPPRSSCMPNALPPSGLGQTPTASHLARPTGSRRSGGESLPGQPLPPPPTPAALQAATATLQMRLPALPITLCSPCLLTAIVS